MIFKKQKSVLKNFKYFNAKYGCHYLKNRDLESKTHRINFTTYFRNCISTSNQKMYDIFFYYKTPPKTRLQFGYPTILLTYLLIHCKMSFCGPLKTLVEFQSFLILTHEIHFLASHFKITVMILSNTNLR